MLLRLACFIRLSTFLSPCLLPSVLWAAVNCSTLDSPIDQKVCQDIISNEYYANGRDWLNSVQKIAAGSEITEGLLNHENRLYIFDSQTADGDRAVYNFPGQFYPPANTAFVSNGTDQLKPRLVLAPSIYMKQFKAIQGGYNLVQNVEISVSQASQSQYQPFVAGDIEGMTWSGVTFKVNYTPEENAVNSAVMLLTLGKNPGGTARYLVENCDFVLPEIDSVSHKVYLVGVIVNGPGLRDPGSEQLILDYKNNRIRSRDYNREGGMVSATGIMITEEVRFNNSVCNEVTDLQGNDLLSADNYKSWLWVSCVTTPDQALGFRNGYGWGWREEGGRVRDHYAPLAEWKQYEIDLTCNTPARAPYITGKTH